MLNTPADFISSEKTPDNSRLTPTLLLFCFYKDELLVRFQNKEYSVPVLEAAEENAELQKIAALPRIYLGRLGEQDCFAVDLSEPLKPPRHKYRNLRRLYGALNDTHLSLGGRAFQTLYWERTHKFCGSCGQPTALKVDERARHCETCNLVFYPRISPAIIVALRKDKRLLLARGPNLPPDFYSVLAGFVEPGENLEDCVRREVKEEVGLQVENIRYFGSQPWPFPDSLMLAFTADYAGGEIQIDGVEIESADWYSADSFPKIPPPMSISRQLIDAFLESV